MMMVMTTRETHVSGGDGDDDGDGVNGDDGDDSDDDGNVKVFLLRLVDKK